MKADDDLVTMAQYRRLVARMDALDGRLSDLHRKTIRELAGEVAAVKRAIGKLTERKDANDGQPEWIGATDPAKARTMLTETWEWVEAVARPLGLHAAPCWPWHSPVVAVLLAGATHYQAVYGGDNAVAVTDFHTRYLDAIDKRVRATMEGCDGHRHKLGDAYYTATADPDRLPELAAWYATGCEGLPPGLRPWLAAASPW